MEKENELHNLRHTLAHLLASAVLEIHPDAKRTIGPAINDGFYYDFEFSTPPSEKDLPKIEKKMREILKEWKEFTNEEKTASEAKEYFKDNLYKLELIEEIEKKGEKITFYTSGKFTDLCRGGHLKNPVKEINPLGFKLDRIAGAYWRGDEKNKMLTRIYGLAFENEEVLNKYLHVREEALKRDHKKLGKELDLFTFSELVGPGLPLWTPKGTTLRNILDEFVWELRKNKGYEKVEIPHITKKDLYETSGHWEKFKEELFRITTREGHEFAMKPMNCPHHTQIFNRKQWSYKDIPQRYANTTMCYRDEQTGELSGLSRLRSFTQDDAHVFCRPNQIKEEMLKIWEIINTFYSAVGFNLTYRLSLHNPDTMDKYLGDENTWLVAEKSLRDLLLENNISFAEAIGEAAFYGPKIDCMGKDSLGREWQVATMQLDMNMPERFDLYCINERNEKERVVMIHAAIMGSIERFLSIIISHFAGAFPLWLSPVQVKILPISTEKHLNYSEKIFKLLSENNIRIELDNSNEGLSKKIRNAKIEKIPYLIVIGDKEKDSNTITAEGRNGDKLENISIEEFIEKILEKVKIKE